MVGIADLLFDCCKNNYDSVSAWLEVTIRTVANFYFIGGVAFFVDALVYFFSGWLLNELGFDVENVLNLTEHGMGNMNFSIVVHVVDQC